MVADEVEDEVVGFFLGGGVGLGVVDYLVGAEGFHHLDVFGAADSGDVGSLGFGDLDGEGTDGAGGAIDEDSLSGLERACLVLNGGVEALEGGDTGGGDGGGLLEIEVDGFEDEFVGGGESGFGEGSAFDFGEDFVSGLEVGDVGSDGLDGAGDVAAEDGVFRFEESGDGAGDVGLAGEEDVVGSVDGGGVDFDEDLVFFGGWGWEVLEG